MILLEPVSQHRGQKGIAAEFKEQRVPRDLLDIQKLKAVAADRVEHLTARRRRFSQHDILLSCGLALRFPIYTRFWHDRPMVDPVNFDAVEETALLQALWRAQATRRDPSRLNDALACEIADAYADPARVARLLSGPAAQVYADLHVACTRAADERLRRWADAIAGRKQIAILGCGFDGRPRRCDFGQDAMFFLVDRPRVLTLLERHLPGDAPRPATLVTANVGDPVALFAALGAAHLRDDLPTAFVVEGVAEFLGLQRTQALIRACRQNGGEDSLLLLQLLDPNLIDFAARAGDTAFPWRKLPAPHDILQDEVARAEIHPIHAEPPWNGGFEAPLAHVVAITL